jgi:hypothetical protein
MSLEDTLSKSLNSAARHAKLAPTAARSSAALPSSAYWIDQMSRAASARVVMLLWEKMLSSNPEISGPDLVQVLWRFAHRPDAQICSKQTHRYTSLRDSVLCSLPELSTFSLTRVLCACAKLNELPLFSETMAVLTPRIHEMNGRDVGSTAYSLALMVSKQSNRDAIFLKQNLTQHSSTLWSTKHRRQEHSSSGSFIFGKSIVTALCTRMAQLVAGSASKRGYVSFAESGAIVCAEEAATLVWALAKLHLHARHPCFPPAFFSVLCGFLTPRLVSLGSLPLRRLACDLAALSAPMELWAETAATALGARLTEPHTNTGELAQFPMDCALLMRAFAWGSTHAHSLAHFPNVQSLLLRLLTLASPRLHEFNSKDALQLGSVWEPVRTYSP